MSNSDDDQMDVDENNGSNENQLFHPRTDQDTWVPCSSREILQETGVINNKNRAKFLIWQILEKREPVAVAFHGINFDSDPPKGDISLVSIATSGGKCIIFDIHSEPEVLTDGQIKYLMQFRAITKVIHDFAAVEPYVVALGVDVHPIFDTKCASNVIQHHNAGTDLHSKNEVSTSFVNVMYGRCDTIPPQNDLQVLLYKNTNLWTARPMSDRFKEYLARQVIFLVPEVYDTMRKQIPPHLKKTFNEMCGNHKIGTMEKVRENIKTYQEAIKQHQKLIPVLEKKCQQYRSNRGSEVPPRNTTISRPGKNKVVSQPNKANSSCSSLDHRSQQNPPPPRILSTSNSTLKLRSSTLIPQKRKFNPVQNSRDDVTRRDTNASKANYSSMKTPASSCDEIKLDGSSKKADEELKKSESEEPKAAKQRKRK